MVCGLLSAISCTDHLIELNKNPNGSDPANANPNMVLSTVLTETGRLVVNMGYQDMAGLMQHTQKDGWGRWPQLPGMGGKQRLVGILFNPPQ